MDNRNLPARVVIARIVRGFRNAKHNRIYSRCDINNYARYMIRDMRHHGG